MFVLIAALFIGAAMYGQTAPIELIDGGGASVSASDYGTTQMHHRRVVRHHRRIVRHHHRPRHKTVVVVHHP